jgi:hypothetical protein
MSRRPTDGHDQRLPDTKPPEGRKFDDDGFKEVVPETGNSLISSCNTIHKSLGSGDKVLLRINSLIISINDWKTEQVAAKISISEYVHADITKFLLIQLKLKKLSTAVGELAQTIRHDTIDDHTAQFFRPEFTNLIDGIVHTEYPPPPLRIHDGWIEEEYARFSAAYEQLIDKATYGWNFEYDTSDDAERERIPKSGIDRLITPYAMNRFKTDITVVKSTVNIIGHLISKDEKASLLKVTMKCAALVGIECRFSDFNGAIKLMLPLINRIMVIIPSMNWNDLQTKGVRHITNIRGIYDYYIQYDTTHEDILQQRDTYMKWLTDLVAAQRKRNREELAEEVHIVTAQICNELGWGRV